MTRVHGHCDRVPTTRVFGLTPLGVRHDTYCPRARTHTQATSPFVGMNTLSLSSVKK
jgi:hypothetical protein